MEERIEMLNKICFNGLKHSCCGKEVKFGTLRKWILKKVLKTLCSTKMSNDEIIALVRSKIPPHLH